MLLAAFEIVMFAAVFVNAAGKNAQLALNRPLAFVTLTVIEQLEDPAATSRFVTEIVPDPAVAVVAAAAFAQVPPIEGVSLTTRPEGSVSVKLTFESAGFPAGFETRNIRTVCPPGAIVVGEKLFVSPGSEAG